jgi:hypothetical protein
MMKDELWMVKEDVQLWKAGPRGKMTTGKK